MAPRRLKAASKSCTTGRGARFAGAKSCTRLGDARESRRVTAQTGPTAHVQWAGATAPARGRRCFCPCRRLRAWGVHEVCRSEGHADRGKAPAVSAPAVTATHTPSLARLSQLSRRLPVALAKRAMHTENRLCPRPLCALLQYSDGFEVAEARVTCRQLGLPDVGALPFLNATFGAGTGPIWLTKLRCWCDGV